MRQLGASTPQLQERILCINVIMTCSLNAASLSACVHAIWPPGTACSHIWHSVGDVQSGRKTRSQSCPMLSTSKALDSCKASSWTPLSEAHLALALIPVLSCKIMCLIFAGRCYFIWHAVSAPTHQLIAFQPPSAAQIPGAASQALTTKHNTCCSYTLAKNPTTAAVAPADDLIASWPVVTSCVPAGDGGALQGRASRRQAQQEERAGRA